MSSSDKLNEVLSALKFTPKEREGFHKAIQVTRDYFREGNVDLEKEYVKIIEEVSSYEISQD